MALQYQLGTCPECKKEGVYIVKKLPGRKFCQGCNTIRLSKDKPPKPPYSIPKSKKPTGELLIFTAKWESTPNKVCEVCGVKVEFAPHTFSHILGKGAYPDFRLLLENLFLACFDCHFSWDNKAKSSLIGEAWDRIKERAQELKERYYRK